MAKRLSDTEALVRQGIKPAGMVLAEDKTSMWGPTREVARGSADFTLEDRKKERERMFSAPLASGPRSVDSEFRRNGVGNESLSAAVKSLKGE